jgi:hypothetical protein
VWKLRSSSEDLTDFEAYRALKKLRHGDNHTHTHQRLQRVTREIVLYAGKKPCRRQTGWGIETAGDCDGRRRGKHRSHIKLGGQSGTAVTPPIEDQPAKSSFGFHQAHGSKGSIWNCELPAVALQSTLRKAYPMRWPQQF